MKIFFSGAMRGGRERQPIYAEMIALLKHHGTVVSGEQIADQNISHYGETDVSKEEIHAREIRLLQGCDVVVAEVTTPSLGVGYVIARALEMQKRVVCLYEGENTYTLSAMIKGNAAVEVYTYRTMNDVARCLEVQLK